MRSEKSQAENVYDSFDMKYPEQVNQKRENADWWLPRPGKWGATA